MNFTDWIPIFVVAALFSVWALLHLSRKSTTFMPKWAWALFIVFTTPLGPLIYVLVEVLDAGVHRADAEGRSPDA
jgi:hypothetical protein